VKSEIKTRVIDIHSGLDAAARKAAQILRDGGVIGYPTETVYGLGCDPHDSKAVKRIAKLKGRESNKPFLILLPNEEALSGISKSLPNYVRSLTQKFWPGPLTLLVRHQNQFPNDLIREQPLIGVRVSPDPFCMALMKQFDHPIVSTSANPARENPARSGREVIRYFENRIDALFDDGERKAQQPSTILDVSSETPRLIREGTILSEILEKYLGHRIER
jgi:L-threonylcarbamoyladenylate synthase